MAATTLLKPQPGPQETFLSTPADIAIYGGAAGGGKTFAMLLEPLRCLNTPGFGAVIFRRTTPQIRNEGGLWDESENLYAPLGLHPRETLLEWEHPTNGNTIKFAHLEHEKNIYDWQGAQIALIGFDELTHFTERQFWYMLSRNRSTCGVRPYVRAGTNPDPDSWVRRLLDWWIGPDGLPIPTRAGVVRWFVRINNEMHWAGTPEELREKFPDSEPKSLTFIPSRLEDNQVLMQQDPGYRANLLALDPVERERLLGGNWDVRPAAGMYFRRVWTRILPEPPVGLIKVVRRWDFAATEPNPNNPNPDWTVGIKVGLTRDKEFVVLDAVRTRSSPAGVERLYVNTTLSDGRDAEQRIPQDPGEAGKSVAHQRARHPDLAGHTIRWERETGDKVTRFGPASAKAEQGLVSVVAGAWNDWFFQDLEGFPTSDHDDTADAFAGAINYLAEQRKADASHLRKAMGLH